MATRRDQASAYEITSRIDGQPDPYVVTVDGGDPDQRPTLRPRRQRVINATSGQRLGQETERATATSARKASIRRTVDRADAGPREQDLLDHVFGLNLRGRDRA